MHAINMLLTIKHTNNKPNTYRHTHSSRVVKAGRKCAVSFLRASRPHFRSGVRLQWVKSSAKLVAKVGRDHHRLFFPPIMFYCCYCSPSLGVYYSSIIITARRSPLVLCFVVFCLFALLHVLFEEEKNSRQGQNYQIKTQKDITSNEICRIDN